MIIPPDRIPPEALDSLIVDYCTRVNGTNDTEDPVQAHKGRIIKLLNEGKLVVYFAKRTQTARITSAEG